ncbi:MAG: murein biosynthesis integral membrane protein MurJ [Patescibacteria group bacterium]
MRKFLSFLGGKNSYLSASLILIVTLFLSNVLGVLRDHYLTQKIPTDILSTYYAAFRIPDLLFNVLILGAISSAFIPVFSSLVYQKKESEAWKVASSVINIAILSLIIFCLILGVLMPYIAPVFVPGFNQEELSLTVKLTRIMLASPIFFGLSYIFGAILNSYKRFLVYSLAPLIYNLSIILGTLFLSPRIGVVGVAIAVVVGAFLHMSIQIPVAIRLGFKWEMVADFKNSFVRKIGILMFPRAIGLGANQIMLLFFTSIASVLGGSAIAIYNLADNIQTMPMVVFGTSFAMAIFPTLSEKISHNDWQGFRNDFTKTLRSILFFIVPMVFGIILLRAQIVRIILGSGHFGWQQTIDTANTLGYFALSLVFTSTVPLLARASYALHNTKIPMMVTVITVIISVITGKILAGSMGVLGLALAYSIGSFFNASILYLLLRKKIQITEWPVVAFFLKVLLASLIMAVALQETKFVMAIFVDMTRFWGVLIQTLASTAIAVLIYLVLTWIFGCEETSSIKVIFGRFRGKVVRDEEPGR